MGVRGQRENRVKADALRFNLVSGESGADRKGIPKQSRCLVP